MNITQGVGGYLLDYAALDSRRPATILFAGGTTMIHMLHYIWMTRVSQPR